MRAISEAANPHHQPRWSELRRESDRILFELLGRSITFETLVSHFAMHSVGVDADDAGRYLDEILGQVGMFFRMDRVALVQFESDKAALTESHRWLNQDMGPDEPIRNIIVSEQSPWVTEQMLAGEIVKIATLEDFPPQASNERQYCQSQGIQSVLLTPIFVEGRAIGILALSTTRHSMDWSPQLIKRVGLVGAIIGSVIQRRKIDNSLRELLELDRMMAELSATFVNLPCEHIDVAILKAMARLCQFLEIDMCTFIQRETEGGGLRHSHQWQRPNLDVPIDFINFDFAVEAPWAAAQIQDLNPIAIRDLSDFPEEARKERAMAEGLGLKSILWAPYSVSGSFAGCVALNTIERQADWSESMIRVLKLFGEIIGNALARKRAEEKLRTAFDEIRELKENLVVENVSLRNKIELRQSHDDIVGNSGVIKAMLQQAEQVAPTDSTVLLLGETGTGKELLAHTIHRISQRADRSMIEVNCAALPVTLIEAELFGREKGAYTGALSRQAGRFELADGSTLFLDEVGDLPAEVQAKLLRVLHTGEFQRLGSGNTITVNARVIAATNVDLARLVQEGKFREDLYYRLNVFPITVPPLRERAADIPALVWSFVRDLELRVGKKVEQIPQRTLTALQRYPWPGNVRELHNVIERAMILSKGRTLHIQLPETVGISKKSVGQSLAEMEHDYIKSALEQTGWRVRGSGGTAAILGLNANTLESRMKKLGIRRPGGAKR